MKVPAKGSEEHIAGFIINKLYHHGCWQKRGKKPRGHHSTTNIKKGYDKTHRGKFNKIIKQLQKRGILNMFPHSGDGDLHVSAILEKDALVKGIEIANRYRVAVGLPAWNTEFDELV